MKILIWIDKQSFPFFTISQGFINLCVCLCQGIKTSLLARHPSPEHTPSTPTPHPCSGLSGCSMGASHRDLLNQVLTLLTSKKIASCSSIRPLTSLHKPEDHSSVPQENSTECYIVALLDNITHD